MLRGPIDRFLCHACNVSRISMFPSGVLLERRAFRAECWYATRFAMP